MPYANDSEQFCVDWAALDKAIQKLLRRDTHIAIKCPSENVKSWFHQKYASNSIVVQCRSGMTIEDIYQKALDSIGVAFDTGATNSTVNLEFIASSIEGSGKRLVIEDLHCLPTSELASIAYDLKVLWDYRCFTVLIGIWTQVDLLTSLNPDLTGRIEEISV